MRRSTLETVLWGIIISMITTSIMLILWVEFNLLEPQSRPNEVPVYNQRAIFYADTLDVKYYDTNYHYYVLSNGWVVQRNSPNFKLIGKRK